MINNQFQQYQTAPVIPQRGTYNLNQGMNTYEQQRSTAVNQLPAALPGRVVFSADQITPQDIPSNGTPALFPLSDGQSIIVRSLRGDGTFSNDVYTLVTPQTNNTQNVDIKSILERLDALEKKVNRKPYRQNNYHKNQNKEVRSDEQ